VGAAGGTFGGEEKYIQGFVSELKEREQLKHQGIGGRIILKWGFNTGDGMAWTGFI
jgi:hypothetical protein